MYPNNGMPNPYQGQQGQPYPDGGMPGYPGQMPGYPGMPMGQQSGYPPMPQQGYQQMGQPQMTPATYPGMGQPSYQMTPATYPGMTPATYPGMTPATYPGFPAAQDQMQQQIHPALNTSYGQAMPQQGYGPPPTQAYGPPQTQAYAPQQPRPTVVPSPTFDASNDAAALRKAMKGFGTDEDALIEVICRRTNGQRMEIVRAFKTCYGKDLIEDIKSETKNNFQKLLVACLTPKIDYYCNELQEAMSGQGTDEDVLIEVMCALPNYDIQAINHNYGRLYGLNLEDTLKADTSGAFKRLMVSLACGNRDESMRTDVNSARNDAQELKEAGVGCWGTDESAFNRVLCMRNYDQLKLVCKEYENLTGHTLEKDIKKEFSGDIEDGLVALVRCANDRAEFFAKRLFNAMDGLGTDDQALIRLVVTRCEIDMVDIKEAFQRKYGKSLKSFIKGDSSGDYKHALYALIGENRS